MTEKEMAEKLSQASSPEEVFEIVKASGQKITLEQAKELFDQIQAFSKEEDLSLDELDTVAGGRQIKGIVHIVGKRIV